MYQINHSVEPLVLWVDLFAGAGGFTSAVEDSFIGRRKFGKVIAAVNHDPYSIKSCKANHSGILCFNEDVRTLNMSLLVDHVNKWRKKYPNAKIGLQAGLECTNFSKAKGGQSRDADSRTLAEHLYRYILALNPDIILIENVTEFLDYGPLRIKAVKETARYSKLAIEQKKNQSPSYVYVPVKHLKGTYYKPWKEQIMSFGYNYDHRILTCADYGLRTIRKRLFIQFVKPEIPLVWPVQTHSKTGENGLKKWKPVKPLLELDDTGESMFHESRKFKGGKSYLRVLKGCLNFVAGIKGAGIKLYIDNYMQLAQEGKYNDRLLNITDSEVKDFMIQYYSNGGDLQSIENPAPAVVSKDQMHKVHVSWMYDDQFMNGGYSVDAPGVTIIASQHKKPLKLATSIFGDRLKYPIDPKKDCPEKIALKLFMIDANIYDIHIRALNIRELLRIQDFRSDYKLFGPENHQKKMIGNAVPRGIAKKIIMATVTELLKNEKEELYLLQAV